jgi:putative transcriptional regulator
MDNSILEVIHETAKGLFEAGVMEESTLRQLEARCLPLVKEYTPQQIQQIRRRTRTSPAVFATYLNTSAATVRQWERGQKKPNGLSLKLLNLVKQKGLEVLI